MLGDPAFQRAPILSRLLQYLCDETIRTAPGALSQFAIAVDGLGRSEDYDRAAESYPRVQISRLRKTLADYYMRRLPGEGYCVFIRHGDYALHLAPLEIAYPDFLTTRLQENQAKEPAAEAVSGKLPEKEEQVWPRTFNRALLAIGLLVIAVALLLHFRSQTEGGVLEAPPRIALNVQAAGIETDAMATEDLRAMVENEARNAITFSPFSRIGKQDEAEYVFNINLAFQPSGKSEIYMNLSDMNAHVIFKKSFPITEDKVKFLEAVSDNMIDIFASNGVLSRELFTRVGDRPHNDFECFVLTETHYSKAFNIPAMVHQCLERFPESPFATYWYTRTALLEYMQEIGQGKPARKAGPGWNNLQKALELDRFNPYANSLAGKVELAQGDCRRSRFYFGRVLSQVYMNQGLQAAALAEQYPCVTDEEQRLLQASLLERLVANNQDSEPPLKFYLMLAALVLERHDLASEVAELPQREGVPTYKMSRAILTVSKAVHDPGYARRKRLEIDAMLSQYLWNPASRAVVERQLYNP